MNGLVPAGTLGEVRAAIEARYVPAALAVTGLDRFLVGTRVLTEPDDDLGIAFMTVWRDLDAARVALDGRLTALRLLGGIDRDLKLDHVDYYEADIVDARRNDGTPRYLRLTAGTVGRGLDADIQRELRTRLPGLRPEAVDAYVGRRVMDQSVQIAFLSTWTDRVDRSALEQPIWPDISAQYDTFWLELFDVLVEGGAGR
ncbi:MAG TPA: hypothetical protein VFP22_00015 [Candidatus Limnocylindrales bacterium]|nr:hypothetical protein [Candidatus Limnocylindrales bacterium]